MVLDGRLEAMEVAEVAGYTYTQLSFGHLSVPQV